MLSAFQDFESKLRPAELKLKEIQKRREENKAKALAEIEALKLKAKESLVETQPRRPRLPTSPSKAVLLGHTDSVNALVTLPRRAASDPERLVSGSGDGTFRVWNLQTWECEKVVKCGEIPACDDEVFCLLVLENVPHVDKQDTEPSTTEIPALLIGGLPGTLKAWSTKTWSCVTVIEDAHKEDISQLAHISYKGKPGFATSSMDHTAKLWNPLDWSCWATLVGHQDSVLSMIAFNGNTMLATGSDDCSIRIWDCSSESSTTNTDSDEVQLSSIKTLSRHTEFVNDLAVCQVGGVEKLVSSSGDFTICVWNLEKWECERVLEKGNIATHLVGSQHVLVVSSLSEKSDYLQCFMNAWMTTGTSWKRQSKCPAIPPCQCLLAVDPSPKTINVGTDSKACSNANAASASTMIHKMLIATGEGEGFSDGNFPVFIWAGGGPAPQRTWTPPKPESDDAQVPKPSIEDKTITETTKMVNNNVSSSLPDQEAVHPPKVVTNGDSSNAVECTDRPKRRRMEDQSRADSSPSLEAASSSSPVMRQDQHGRQDGQLGGDELVKAVLRPLLQTRGISLEMRILIDSCLRLPAKR